MDIKGGYSSYGQHIGVLMLDTVFPRLIGDIGNADTFSFPVRYKVVQGALPHLINRSDPGAALLPYFIAAAKELEQEGVKAIASSCGLLASFQRELAESVSIPVFASSLMLVPLCYQLTGRKKPVGIITIRKESISTRQCEGAGWSLDEIPIRIIGMEGKPHFTEVYADNGTSLNAEILENEVGELANQFIKENPAIGSIVLECTNLAPFSPLIRRLTGRPVFGMDDLVRFIHRSLI